MIRPWPNVVMIFTSLILATAQQSYAQDDKSDLPSPLATDAAKASYGMGFQTGSQFASGDIDFDVDAFVSGMKDALAKVKPRLSDVQIQTAMQRIEQAAQARYQARMKPESDKNKKAAADFIAKYKKIKGVRTLPNGIYFKVLTPGKGASPSSDSDVVKVHYQGRLVDGTEFDSSYKRQEPATFPLNRVIPGWTAAVQKMKVGGKWQVVIPPELAYGPGGSPPKIGPDATLVFDIELLDIVSGGGQ
ncbi:FKBP-type peptidyl-prolyl cis-trans isomerase [Planctomycetota bacterium]